MGRRNYASLDDAVSNGEGEERPFQCHMHADSNASASVNVVKGVWYCHACNAAGRVDRKGATLTAEMRRTVAALVEDDESYHREEWLDWFDQFGPHPYWVHRFGPFICKEFRLGTHPMTLNPTYPFRDRHGRVMGVVQRTDWQPKYLYPAGVSASRSLFGWEKCSHSSPEAMLVVEGACDVMAVHSLELPFDLAVVGCYGAGLHLPQVQLINALSPGLVILGFDNDDAGRRASERNYPLETATVSVTWAGKDPGDSTPQQVRDVLAAAMRKTKGRRNG